MWAGRLSLTWNASENTEVNFMYSYFEEDDNGAAFAPRSRHACTTLRAFWVRWLIWEAEYQNTNSAAGITVGALMALISGLNTGAQGYLGINFPAATGQANYAALGLNAITGAAFFTTFDQSR